MSEPTWIENGIEYFDVPNGTDAQCARCGSSVTHIEDDSLDGSGFTGDVCLSEADWCDAHPLPGRENQAGGHGRPIPDGALNG